MPASCHSVGESRRRSGELYSKISKAGVLLSKRACKPNWQCGAIYHGTLLLSAIGKTCAPGKSVDPKPKQKPKPKGKAGETVKGKKKYCRGCRKWLDFAVFASNSSLCVGDKRAWAKKQEKGEWLKKVQASDDTFFKVTRQYHRISPESESGGRRARNSSRAFLQTVERMSSETIIDLLTEGEMMWESAWYEFASTARGGGYTFEGMRAEWQLMLQQAKNGERLQDHDGPNGAVQVWVRTSKKVNYHERVRKERGYEAALQGLREGGSSGCVCCEIICQCTERCSPAHVQSECLCHRVLAD